MKRYSFFIFFIFYSIITIAQNLGAYSDYKNYFYAFDGGPNFELESQAITSYKVGGNAVAYVNGTTNFKAYYRGDVYELLSIAPAAYIATDNLVTFYNNTILAVFDNGERKILSGNVGKYKAGDSLIAFYDLNNSYLRAYYNSTTQDIEPIMGDDPDSIKFEVGDNIIAYINSANQFKLFYDEQVVTLESYAPADFKAGKNIIAYIDGYTQNFKIFYKGMSYTIDNVAPNSFKVGDDMVAFISNTGDFKIFFQGQLLKVTSFAPTFYDVTDDVVDFFDNQFYTAFYDGKLTKLETYIPQAIQKDYKTIAYIDRRGYLKALYNGKQQQISEEKVVSFELSGNVLKYNSGMSDIKFFLNGKTIVH